MREALVVNKSPQSRSKVNEPAHRLPSRVALVRVDKQAVHSAGQAQEHLEREADRIAEQVANGTSHGRNHNLLQVDTSGFEPAAMLHGSTGQLLNASVRAAMEARFGHDFSQVRVHTDARAADAADASGSRAYTVGTHMMFGPGQYDPTSTTGRQLLAHELAHVIQQQGQTRRLPGGRVLSAAPPSVQHKLVLTGGAADLARVVAVMNAGLGPEFQAIPNAKGEVEIVRTGMLGPPSPENQVFTTRLRALEAEGGTTTVGVVSGGMPIVGSYALSQIDIGDIEALGIGQRGWDARAALLHELVEQRQKQLGATAAERGYGSPTTGAHGQGLAAELGMIGAVLESDTGLVGATQNPDGTMNGSRTVVFRYPDGTRWRVEVTLSSNNITNVTRTKLP
jgi:hypothetical protein